jgi:uncharacterized protein YbaR (Trm112 family)
MTEEILDCLRCPIDPMRETELDRDGQTLTCRQCRVQYPIRNGMPNLTPDGGVLPEGITELSQLKCKRKANRRF